MNYNDIVVSDEMTCFACPTQYEGELVDGRFFYFRYRHGTAQLGVGEDIDAAIGATFTPGSVNAWETLGDGLDGVLDNAEYRASFVRLYQRLDNPTEH